MPEGVTFETAAKAVVYVATLCYVGAVTTAALSPTASAPTYWQLAVRVGRTAAFVALVALMTRAVAHAATVADGWPGADILRTVIGDSRWGGRWQWQVAAVSVALLAWRGRRSRPALMAAVAAACGWCAALPLLGHGASSTWQQVTHGLHVAVAGVWLGTVCVLAISTRPRGGVSPVELSSVIARFSPWALTCAAAAALSGLVLAVTYVGAPSQLFASLYGRWLIAKITAVAVVAGCGYVNWSRVRSQLAPERRWLVAEAVAALAIALITAVLSEVEHPG